MLLGRFIVESGSRMQRRAAHMSTRSAAAAAAVARGGAGEQPAASAPRRRRRSPQPDTDAGGGAAAAAAAAAGAAPHPAPPPQQQQQPKRQKKPARTATTPAERAPAAASRSSIDSTPAAAVRCEWATMYAGAGSAAYVAYHDTEWGRPEHNDHRLFELLVLEGAQAGLSWATILNKRPGYRAAFHNFDPSKVAAMDDAQLDALAADPGGAVVRHRGKLASAVNNAKVMLQLQREHGSIDAFVWSFVPHGRPIVNAWTSLQQIPTKSPESEALSAALKRSGCTFVGPTTMYAFMQAAGLVNDHVVGCHCRQAIIDGYE